MARMHSRKKGKSTSTTPKTKEKKWLSYSKEEIEKLILKLAKAGKSQAQIGTELRDSYGIPNIKNTTKKTVLKILKENKAAPELPEDIYNLIKREIALIKHLEKNHKDMPAKRGLQLTESKIRRLTKYYKKTGVLPEDWKYSKEQARLIIG